MAQPSPAVVPSSQPRAHSHASPTTKPREPPTPYPSNADGVAHTRLSYHKQPIPGLPEGKSGWTLCLPIEIPSDLINPTLISLVYTIKYATAWENGNATVQADTFLTPKSCPEGIIHDPTDLGVYNTSVSGYGPVILNEEVALILSSVLAIKYNGGTAKWSHYIDHNRLTPNLRIMQPSNLYLAFHVYEYPTTTMLRCLTVQASATWLDDLEEREWREMERKEQEWRSVEAAAAAPVANAEVQDRIREMGMKYGVNCPSGYAWNKVVDGYRCGGGGHFLTFHQLGMSRRSLHK